MMITEGLLQSKWLTQCFRTKTTLSLLCTWVLCWFVFALVTCFGWVDQPKHSMKVHELYENLAFQPLNIPHIPRVSQWVCQWWKTDFPLRAPCNPSVARSPINHQGYCVRSIWHAIPYMVPTFDQSPMGVRVPFGIQKMTSPFNQSPPLEPSATLCPLLTFPWLSHLPSDTAQEELTQRQTEAGRHIQTCILLKRRNTYTCAYSCSEASQTELVSLRSCQPGLLLLLSQPPE